ncbi:MAG: 16S rRNA (cytosine(1402)-N(4))-methyltransferase RsmH [Clostridia bacterium]|nr:16S rRNA (cytosine(1402)-N(4))-methyltransferase RsmH [Clostridia bacterium]
MEFYHEPVMLDEVITGLNLKKTSIVVDCTLGGGGHSSEIIKKIPQGLLIGIDKDLEAINYSKNRLKNFDNIIYVKDDFKNFDDILNSQKIKKVDAVLIDLGISSHQINEAERGFSFLHDGPLDMRMNQEQKFSAYDIVNFYDRKELIKILTTFGEEKFAPLIVSNILKHRAVKEIKTTKQLNQIIEEILPKKIVYKRGGAAKKTFQALRIAVNGELANLDKSLEQIIQRLNSNGRLVVISFHSLEDRIVKTVFKKSAARCICPPTAPICVCNHKPEIKLITKKPLIPSTEEISKNPRSSSAKLRIIEKFFSPYF